MKGKSKGLFTLALIIALGGFAYYVLMHSNARPSTVQTFPDGSILMLEGVQMTNGFHSFSSKSVTGWRKKLTNVLPRTWTRRLGWLPMGGSLTIGAGGRGSSLGVFTLYDGKVNAFTFTRLVIFDEQGNAFDAGGAMGTLGSSDGTNFLRIDGWLPPAFPRRGKTLGLRYFEKKNTNWEQIVEFVIPNPAQGNYPTWTAEALPTTRTNGDLSVTLTNLISGLSKDEAMFNTPYGVSMEGLNLASGKAGARRAAGSNEIAVTEAVFRVEQAGRSTNAWRPISVEISDATGNQWTPFAHTTKTEHEGGLDYFAFDGALWPGEAAWKMRFEFSRVADFEPEEIFAFTGVILPGATQVINLDNVTNINDSKVRLVAISGPDAEQPGNLKWSTTKKRTNFSIRINPLPPEHRLTLLKVIDENGREAEVYPQPDWNSVERVYAFKAPEGATQVSFTFALHKSRYVEFLGRPGFVRGN